MSRPEIATRASATRAQSGFRLLQADPDFVTAMPGKHRDGEVFSGARAIAQSRDRLPAPGAYLNECSEHFIRILPDLPEYTLMRLRVAQEIASTGGAIRSEGVEIADASSDRLKFHRAALNPQTGFHEMWS